MGSLKILLLIIIIPCLALGQEIKSTFFSRCEKFKEYDCQKLWDLFEKAHVNKDPCNISVEAYDRLIAAASFKPESNKAMLWSLTKNLVRELKTSRPECFQPLLKTPLASVLEGLTWCGKEGSKELTKVNMHIVVIDTFATTREPKDNCKIQCNSISDSDSADYAAAASGHVTALLNGSTNPPFSTSGVFACVEVRKLDPKKVKRLDVVIVSENKAKSTCSHTCLNELRKMLAKGISYTCKVVSKSQIDDCIKNESILCADCFSGSWVVRPSVLSFIVLCFSFMF